MARIRLIFPDNIIGKIEIPIRITDVNYGNHVGNDAIVSIIHEARVAWLRSLHLSEMNIGGTAIIMNELAVNYLNESFYGDLLNVDIAAGEISNAGFELYYRLHVVREGKNLIIGIAKTGIRCFDYHEKKIMSLPESFKKILLPES